MIPIFRSAFRPALLAAPLLLALAACGDPSGSEPRPEPRRGIQLVSGHGLADTVQAIPAQMLVVEVRDTAGALRPGAAVEFEGVRFNTGQRSMLVAPAGGGDFVPQVTATADAQGRASVRVRFGFFAPATGRVAVRVPSLGLADTATYTIRPGNPVEIFAAPLDTAVYVGSSYTMHPFMRDRRGNFIQEPGVALRVLGPQVSLSGATVTGQAYGRTGIVAEARGFADTAWVSVVPRGTLLASDDFDELWIFDLDGSNSRRLRIRGTHPRWMPDGTRFLFSDAGRVFISEVNGTPRRLVPEGQLEGEEWPHPSRDGQWVYLSAIRDGVRSIFRVRPDGTGLERVSALPLDAHPSDPSPSPDGTRLAFTRDPAWGNGEIRVAELAGGALRASGIAGRSPEWSRGGGAIAYVQSVPGTSGPLRLMAPDGTGGRTVTADPARRYDPGIDWSPDDRWIVAHSASPGQVEVIEVATGLTVPVPFTDAFVFVILRQAAWRPAPAP